MKQIIIIAIIFVIFFKHGVTQDNSNIIWVKPISKALRINGMRNVNDVDIKKLFEEHKASYYKQALPFAKNPKLKKIYQIQCENNIQAKKLYKELKVRFNHKFQNIRLLREPIPTYIPSDYAWSQGWMWYLEKINADLAWDITKGDANVKIAIIDTWFDPTHPDLENKLLYDYDHYSGVVFNDNCCKNHHGTHVASCAAAETDGGGQMASVGFNVSIVPFTWGNGLTKALYASNKLDVDVINISWFNACSPDQTGTDKAIIKEILDNGTIIVAAAGNGYQGACCSINGDDRPPFSPLFPFSPLYDDRLICVSSTDRYDNHKYIKNGDTLTHSFYSEVDICAPGYSVMRADQTQSDTCQSGCTSNCCVNNSWPYYGGGTGTSLATPIVSGTCGLMKSVNPSITPAQAQEIIKKTADPISDEHLFPGMVGEGRINAYCAVKQAKPLGINPSGFSGGYIDMDYSVTRYFVNFDYIKICNHSDVTVNAAEVTINGKFEVEKGSTFLISNTDSYNCNY